MRDFLNTVLAFIGAENLTDDEFDALTIEDTDSDSDNYGALLAVLNSRDSVSNTKNRLAYYYQAKGLLILADENAQSNILLGGAIPCS